jgi:argininosuccinate lyase
MVKKAWGGRFAAPTDQSLEEFGSSIGFDKRLYKQDIEGTRAYAKALLKAKILKQTEFSQISSALTKIEKDITEGKIKFAKHHEDIHMNIEMLLTERIGEAGKKIHTGRSRNDQVATDFRMYVRDEITAIKALLRQFQKTLIKLAEEYIDISMPGYTHMQKAQPVLLSHHLMAYYQMFKRDSQRFSECLERANVLPLGSAALAGTGYDIDRKLIAKQLEFSSVSKNSLDAVSDRDFAIEFASASSICMMHLSRMAEELILWATAEFKFIELADEFSTGSSIMPQKKNPDIAELVRGKTGRVYGNLVALLTMMKALPLAYNRDMQEDKERVFDTADTIKPAIAMMENLLKTATIKDVNMFQAAEKGCLTATDLADYLVRKGVPFRSAHEITGNIVKHCVDTGRDLFQLSSKDYKKFCDKITEDIHDHLTVEASIARRNIIGGTARNQVSFSIREAKEDLKRA